MLFSNKNRGFIFRATGSNLNNNNAPYYGGKFFADNPYDVGEYGDTIKVYKLLPEAKLFSYDGSIQFCEDNGYSEMDFEIVSVLSDGKFTNLGDAIEYYHYNGENPSIGYAITQAVARQILQKKRYDGAEWDDEDDLIPHQFQIWDNKVLEFVETLNSQQAEKKYM